MTLDDEALMNEAREAIVKKDSRTARRVLRQITRQDPSNYRAWLWLAGVTDAPAASLQYVKRAQEIAPNEERVIDALEWARSRVAKAADTPSKIIRVRAANKFAPEAEIEEVRKKPVNPWLRRLGIGLLVIMAGLALFTIYQQTGLISAVPQEPIVAMQSSFVAASAPAELVAATDSEPLVAIIAQPTATATSVATETPQKKSLPL